jgi:hypothetical protein
MFSDLVGSTALSVRMDLEDLREVISAYQKWRCGARQRAQSEPAVHDRVARNMTIDLAQKSEPLADL